MSTLYNSDIILLSPPFLLGLSQSKCESKEDEEKQLDYDKEPNYSGRTATVNTNFNPKRKNRTGESKSYPLTRLPSDKARLIKFIAPYKISRASAAPAQRQRSASAAPAQRQRSASA